MKHIITITMLVVITTNINNTRTYQQLRQAMAILEYEEKHADALLQLWDEKLQNERKIYVLPPKLKTTFRPRKY